MLTTRAATPVELASEPEIHRLPLQGRRELVVPPSQAIPEDVKSAPEAAEGPRGDPQPTRALDPRSRPRGTPPTPAASGPTVVPLGGGVILYGHLLARAEPLVGACIDVAPEDESETFCGVVETDSQGRYEIRLPQGGFYAFTVTHEERELHGRQIQCIPNVKSHRRVTGAVTTMRTGEKPLEKPLELSGVQVVLAATPDGPMAVAATSRFRQGRFEFTVLTPGTYSVRSMGLRRREVHRFDPTIGHGYGASPDLALEHDGDHGEAELALGDGCTVRGTVLCAHSPRHSPHVLGVRYLGEPLHLARYEFTDESSFEIEGLAPGRVGITANSDASPQAGPVELTLNEPVTIELTYGLRHGLVKLIANGVDWKTLSLHDAMGFPVLILPYQNGGFSGFRPDGGGSPQALATPLRPGDYTVRAKRGCVELEHPIRVTEAREQEFRIDF